MEDILRIPSGGMEWKWDLFARSLLGEAALVHKKGLQKRGNMAYMYFIDGWECATTAVLTTDAYTDDLECVVSYARLLLPAAVNSV